jgi:hypothetical protein
MRSSQLVRFFLFLAAYFAICAIAIERLYTGHPWHAAADGLMAIFCIVRAAAIRYRLLSKR